MKAPRVPSKPRPPKGNEPHGNINPFQHKRSKAAEDCVIEWLKKGRSLGYAAEQANISRNSLKGWREDKAFNERVEEAIECGTDLIEDEATRRAVDGVEKPVFQGGECVGHVQEYSDPLMMMILGGRRGKYAKRNGVKVTSNGEDEDGKPVVTSIEVEFV